MLRGIRGAVTVEENTAEAIEEGTKELLQEMMEKNKITAGDIVSALFTVTNDLNAAFPATAARQCVDWDKVPMLCSVEIPVPGALPLCIRALLHIDTEIAQKDIQHIYLRNAAALRKDLVR